MTSKKRNKPKPFYIKAKTFVIKHSLSFVLAALTITLKVFGYISEPGYWQDSFNGFGDDSWGALLIVIATKYFIERGSPESK